MVGTDVHSGVQRYTFGLPELADGIGFVSVAVGMFGIAEIILRLEAVTESPVPGHQSLEMKLLAPLLRRITPSILRGTAVGSVLGALPGCSPAVASFYAYIIERKSARNPDEFGHGAVEGVAAPESANNAAAQTAFIPLLALGLPSNGVMSLMIGAMTLHGIQPGPQIIDKMPDLFWGLVVSMWLGNLILLMLNLPLIRLWVAVLRIPYALLYPALLLFCCIGAYSLGNSYFDILVTAGFGVFGYLVIKLGFEPTPLLLGYILGPMLEDNLRRTLLLSGGDFTVFVSRPIAAGLLLVATFVILSKLRLRGRSRRKA
jgi:putative tricarboxylic transport membrane protein